MQIPFLIICMGVSGCGKSTLAARLAREVKAVFAEADDFHSEQNKAHMAAGKPLTDDMRAPWIQAMCDHIVALKDEGKSCVLAYSGLRAEHRQKFRTLGLPVLFVYLKGSKALIAKRMAARKGHFMPAQLLNSQFAAMQSPEGEDDCVVVKIDQPVSKIYYEVLGLVKSRLTQDAKRET